MKRKNSVEVLLGNHYFMNKEDLYSTNKKLGWIIPQSIYDGNFRTSLASFLPKQCGESDETSRIFCWYVNFSEING